jgi:hypothetical protein
MTEVQYAGKVLLSRRSPLTISEISSKSHTNRKTTRNAITEVAKISTWLPSDKRLVSLRHKNRVLYCVRNANEVDMASSFNHRGRNYHRFNSNSTRCQFISY